MVMEIRITFKENGLEKGENSQRLWKCSILIRLEISQCMLLSKFIELYLHKICMLQCLYSGSIHNLQTLETIQMSLY